MYINQYENKICPLCNGLKNYIYFCSKCSALMKDGGKVSDYYDEYSPYLPETVLGELNEENNEYCTHLFICPNCNNYEKIKISKSYF